MSSGNAQIIEEFRANGGAVGGRFEGAPIVLVHHTGAKTGNEYVQPLVYQDLGNGSIAIFASKGGHTEDPHWLANLVAHPETTIEIGTETRKVRARVAEDDERERIWEKQKQLMPNFAEYEKTADRVIPVVLLEHE